MDVKPARDRGQLRTTGSWLSMYLAVLFIGYCLVCLIACPSPPLAAATVGELLLLVISIMLWKANLFQLPVQLSQRLPERMRKLFGKALQHVGMLKCALLALVAVLLTVDFSALALSAAGLNTAGTEMYARLPVSYWLGLHPAFSAEMLTGALVQHENYDRAEPLYNEIMEIRMRIAGPRSDLMSAMYADMGDFAVRRGQLAAAEQWYRKSVELGTKTGRAKTGLATVLREEGKYQESRKHYFAALEVRKNVYGESSRQYNDTLRGYHRLIEKIAEPQKAPRPTCRDR